MKKLTIAFVQAAIMVSVSFTGALAQGPDDGPGKPDISVEDAAKAPGAPGQRQGAPRDAPRDDNRRERDKAIREFQMAVRNAERKFKTDEKAASKLQGEERKAAIQKAADEMKASIKKAEKDKNAVVGENGPGTHKPKGRMDHPGKDSGEGPPGVKQGSAGQAEGQLKPGNDNPPEQQKN